MVSIVLAGVLDVDLVQSALHLDDVFGVTLDVGGLSLEAAGRLVDQDAGIGEREAHVLGSPAQSRSEPIEAASPMHRSRPPA